MRKLATAIAIVLFAMPAPMMAMAQTAKLSDMPAGTFKSDPTHTSVTFKVNHLGLSNYTARFTKVDAELQLDPKVPSHSVLKVTIDPTSIRTDYPEGGKVDFDEELGKDEKWLNGKKFPAMTFNSTGIKALGTKTGKVTGDFTMLGVTKPLTLNVTFNGAYAEHPMTKKPMLGFSATTTIKRSDWGLTAGVPYVGDDVQVWIETEFGKQ